jgi:hypothetical protein
VNAMNIEDLSVVHFYYFIDVLTLLCGKQIAQESCRFYSQVIKLVGYQILCLREQENFAINLLAIVVKIRDAI